MDIYPSWLEFVRILGLDPITVWIEYKTILFICLGLCVISALILIYFAIRALRSFLETFHLVRPDRAAFYKSVEEIELQWRQSVLSSLGSEQLIYGMPAVILQDVEGFRQGLGVLVLSGTKLSFFGKSQKSKAPEAIHQVNFPLDTFRDANIKEGVRGLELKLVFEDKRPTFQLLGINRDMGQELFMRMHALRLALKEQKS